MFYIVMRFAMMRVFLGVFFFCVSVGAYAVERDRPFIDYDQFNYYELEEGYQGGVPGEAVSLDLGDGSRISAYFYALPLLMRSHTVVLSSLIHDDQLYQPVVVLLSRDFRVLREIDLPTRVSTVVGKGLGVSRDIMISGDAAYMVIKTDPILIGKTIEYQKNNSTTMPVSSGGTTTYVPGPSFRTVARAQYSNSAELNIMVPYRDNFRPVERQQGSYMTIGVSFGGDRVAVNPTGDNYNAGSGGIIGVGYAKPLFKSQTLLGRLSIAGRYQGGEGNSQGIVGKAMVVHSEKYFNVGGGLYLDFMNQVEDINGVTTEFEDSAGGAVFAEWRMGSNASLGVQYLMTDYETDKGVTYDGNQFSLYLLLGI